MSAGAIIAITLLILIIAAAIILVCVFTNNPKRSIFNAGINPVAVAITPNQKYLYIANSNEYEAANSYNVTVVDLTNRISILTINDSSFNHPASITVNPQGTKVYVTNGNGTTITVIDVATNTISEVLDGFDGPVAMVINSSGTLGYVANYGTSPGFGGTVQIIDLTTNTITGSVTVVQAPQGLTLSSDNNKLYVVSYNTGTVNDGALTIIDTATNTIIDTISGFFGPSSVVLSKDNNTAYVSNFGNYDFVNYGTSVSVVDLQTKQITSNIQTGVQPSGMTILSNKLYVANFNAMIVGGQLILGEGTVSIIDTTTNKLIEPTIPTGDGPAYLIGNGNYIYVPNASGTVHAIPV